MKSVSASSSNVSASKNNFGEFVRNTRLDLGLSLREFATKLNLSPAFISKMEIGGLKSPKEENIKNNT